MGGVRSNEQTANKANNTITISPATTTINVVNGLYNGNSYYTINISKIN